MKPKLKSSIQTQDIFTKYFKPGLRTHLAALVGFLEWTKAE